MIGGFTIQEEGNLLLFMDHRSIAVSRNGVFDFVVDEIREERDNRFNDIVADPAGNVFCGATATETRPARLYRLDSSGGLHERAIKFPAKKVSSVALGGPALTDIYVSTIGGDNRAEEGPGAEALFRLQFGIPGVPEFHSGVGL